jgi:hypothetical protein
MICIGEELPPGGNELIFMGRYRLVSSAPEGFPSTCPARETETTPLCRFEVIVRGSDMNGALTRGDYFQIRLSSETLLVSELDPATFSIPGPACYRVAISRLISAWDRQADARGDIARAEPSRD